MTDRTRPTVLVIGLGNELRHDDGAGIEIARRVRDRSRGIGIDVRELPGEPISLLDAWQAHDVVIIVDTMRSGARCGTLRRLDARRDPVPIALRGCRSTHALGLGEVIELARTIELLPAWLVIYAVEGARFDAGTGLSAEVHAIIPGAAEAVLDEARRLGPPLTARRATRPSAGAGFSAVALR